MVIAKNAKRKEFKRCRDCNKKISVENGKITGGIMAVYDNEGEKLQVFKCNACFQKNPGLSNFQKCEVYSRVVGYLRPVQQWNEGKQLEYQERKEYKIS